MKTDMDKYQGFLEDAVISDIFRHKLNGSGKYYEISSDVFKTEGQKLWMNKKELKGVSDYFLKLSKMLGKKKT